MTTVEHLAHRWPAVRPFLLVGTTCITAGGVVAAVSRPTDFGNGPWLAAYLVLVAGVAQVALGAGQAWLAADVPSPRLVRWQLSTWNLGAAGVVVGTLVAVPLLTSIGGAVTIVALVLFLAGVRRTGLVPRWVPMAYRAVVAIVLVSIPIGLTMAWTRHR